MRGVDVPKFCRGESTFPHHPRKDDDDSDQDPGDWLGVKRRAVEPPEGGETRKRTK